MFFWCVFFFKQKTAYEMRISDWSSDVCSSDLHTANAQPRKTRGGRNKDKAASGTAGKHADDAERGNRPAKERAAPQGKPKQPATVESVDTHAAPAKPETGRHNETKVAALAGIAQTNTPPPVSSKTTTPTP